MGCFSGPQIPVPPPPMEWPKFEFPEMEFPEMSFPEMPAFPETKFPEFPTPYDPDAAAARARRAEEVERLKQIQMKRKGFGSTILTGGRGLEDEDPGGVKRPSLLGSA